MASFVKMKMNVDLMALMIATKTQTVQTPLGHTFAPATLDTVEMGNCVKI
jgi:hypothetical protein